MASSTVEEAQRRAPASAWLLSILLTLCYILSIVDRNIISFVAIDIKRDLAISDFQLGMVQGFAFSIFYAIAGLPLGWAIDRFQRRRLLSAALFVWSAMTIWCGAAQNFLMLAIGRVGVGAGEAALTPGSYSMMSDVFPKKQFARASAIYSLGPPLAAASAAALAGLVLGNAAADGSVHLPVLGDLKGWRALFLIAGAPGIILAAALLLVREPVRTKPAGSMSDKDRLFDFLKLNWRTHAVFALAVMLSSAIGTSFSAWVPATLERSFDWSKVDISKAMAAIGLICGISGSVIGGTLTSWLIARDRTVFILYIGMASVFLTLTCGLAILALPGSRAFIAAVAVCGVVYPLIMMISPTFLQIITPSHLRGRMTALFLFINVGIGAGAGPTLVGFFSSHVYSGDALPKSLATLLIGASALALFAYAYLLRFMPKYLASTGK